jgi:hypothetical protein
MIEITQCKYKIINGSTVFYFHSEESYNISVERAKTMHNLGAMFTIGMYAHYVVDKERNQILKNISCENIEEFFDIVLGVNT